jgi:hypothetical protein
MLPAAVSSALGGLAVDAAAVAGAVLFAWVSRKVHQFMKKAL